MIAGLASSVVVMSCLGCATPSADAQAVVLDIGPLGSVGGAEAFSSNDASRDKVFAAAPEANFQLPLKTGNDFSPNNFAHPLEAARFEALDLATPMPVRSLRGDLWSAEVSFSASAERTGLGLDLSIVPRAQIQQNRAGNNIARAGAEVRVGPNLADRDLRKHNALAPSWYFFVGADNEALVWNLADKAAMDGATLRDQATVGDLQAGIAWSTGKGAQMSFGLVERKLTFTDLAGDHDVDRRERFAAFSFTLHH
jgi:Uncharacterized protein conserved in bacteria (DUF2219)